MTAKLDKYEKDILESYENDEWVEVPDMKNEIKGMQHMQKVQSGKIKG